MTPYIQEVVTRCTLRGWRLVRVFDNNYGDIVEAIREAGINPTGGAEPLRRWEEFLRKIRHCQYCGARVRYAFQLAHDDMPSGIPCDDDVDVIYVGSECVKSFVADLNGKESVAFLRSKWRQRRGYYWKRFLDQAVIVGQGEYSWWTATAYSITDRRTWDFKARGFKTGREAQHYIHMLALTGKPPRPLPTPRSQRSYLTGADIVAQAKARVDAQKLEAQL